MKKIIKTSFILLLLLLSVLFVASCSSDEDPYSVNNGEGYTVTVKYDANGGSFSTGTDVIADSYDLADVKENKNGKIVLIAPDDPIRGKANTFSATKAGYFLAGWYTERVETTDADGEKAYTYSGRWDFAKDRYIVDPSKEYSANEPVLTLYAAWIPEFSFEFYDIESGELIEEFFFDPNFTSDLEMPSWNKETGKLKMNKFPSVRGKTFDKAYLDKDGTQPIDSDRVAHSGLYDPETASASDVTMKIYLDYIDGEWFHVHTAEQFISNASTTSNFVICSDLDFTGLKWKGTLAQGAFRGTIIGDGHTLRNISYTQNDHAMNTGLFGKLDDKAVITDLHIENATLTVKIGARTQGANFGLLAGSISDNAKISDVSVTGKIVLDTEVLFMNAVNIGLVAGSGYRDTVSYADIELIYDGTQYNVTVNGNDVAISTT